MKKYLPIEINNYGILECWTFLRMAVIETYPDFKLWKYEKLNVGQLGTELSSILFGMDVYPIRYDSTVNIQGFGFIHMINYLLSKIEAKYPDIILAGIQFQSLHFNTGNLNFYLIYNYELLIVS